MHELATNDCEADLMSFDPNDRATCPTCGHPLDDHNRHVRFLLPTPVLELPEQESTAGAWMSHDDANSSVMMQVPDVGPFCRCLLPVQLDGGYSVHFGVWIGIHPDDLQRAFAKWWSSDYSTLEMDGYLANSLPGWGCLGAPVHALVKDPESTPYIVASSDDVLAEVLQQDWPHDQVLGLLPS
jgi:hypothetical protein